MLLNNHVYTLNVPLCLSNAGFDSVEAKSHSQLSFSVAKQSELISRD